MKQTKLIVDLSYLIYYSMHSAISIFSRDFEDLIVESSKFDPAEHEEFLQIFKRRFNTCLWKRAKELAPFMKYDDIIFAKDCPKKYIWRNDFFKEYKLARKTADKSEQSFSYNGTFNYVFNTLIPEYVENGACMIECPSAEGDDVIAVLTKHIKDEFNIIIIASDRDIMQLLDDHVRMITCKGDELSFESHFKKHWEKIDNRDQFTGKEFVLIKMIQGDPSDGIPHIHDRCGQVTAIKYLNNRELLKEKIKTNPDIVKVIKTNRRLIDFDYIPETICKKIISNYKETQPKDEFGEL
jgi:5'-3' exonuclease